ncbi:putative transcription factor C2H2 family [Lupinus albus]|uniref:Putative transcription factor C2H2 family n=1 Tax=Lupinus albus TaxID=3870 RepID=A0A6A4R2C4_LUPAL|nr:putative transcription factor C2H2 family [Lupinus albus]
MADVKRRLRSNIRAFHKELDEVACPICMDHPHNVVLLCCSSHEKGCKSYICDTNYMHSNCLDRFKKLRDNSKDSPNLVNTNNSGRHLDPHGEGILEIVDSETLQDRAVIEDLDADSSSESKMSLKCPLCRGTIQGWEVNYEARNHLNMKKRSCFMDSYTFVGNYLELCRHARRVHPSSRPFDVDPVRERD